MASFQYKGRRDGRTLNGTIEAADRKQAILLLSGQGVVLQTLAESDAVQVGAVRVGLSLKIRARNKKIKPRNITNLTRQLATLLEAGFPLARALEFAARQDTSGPMAKMLESLSSAIQQGRDFSQALADYPQYFGDIFLLVGYLKLDGGKRVRVGDESLLDCFVAGHGGASLLI